MKRCTRCDVDQDESHFKIIKNQYSKWCIDCLKEQQTHRKETNNLETKKYEKTINGFLMRLYRNMKSRIMGIQKQKSYLYKDKELLDKEAFYEWAKTQKDFFALWEQYKESGWDRKLAPSVDRVDSSLGYEISNMEWVTLSENSRRGAFSKWQNT